MISKTEVRPTLQYELPDAKTKKKFCCSREYLVIYSAVTLVLATLVISVIFLYASNINNNCSCNNDIIRSTDEIIEKKTLDFYEKPSYTFGNKTNLNGCKIIEEEDWGVKRSLDDIRMKYPIPIVIVSHSSSPFCNNFTRCKENIAETQKYHISYGSPDIGYNFMIGGDGNIYVGRGWNARNFLLGNHSIGLNFVGNYFRDKLTPKMIQCAKAILEFGVGTKILTDDYKLLCHSQTADTLSPGPNVCEEIKKWPYYLSGKVDRNLLYTS